MRQVLTALGQVEGELLALRDELPAALPAARVLEAVVECLCDGEGWDHAKELQACATKLLHAARPGGSSMHAAPDERGRSAERIRDVVARALRNGERDPAFLAGLVAFTNTQTPGRVLGSETNPGARWTGAIRAVLEDPPRTLLAETIVEACARAVGHRKPGDLWGRESKAANRRADRSQKRPLARRS